MRIRPYITLSYAQSLDGRLATRTGDSQWISGPDSLTLAQELRRDNQAILVGINTVLRDNPRLTCRLPGARSPIRVVLDSQLRLPVDCHLTQDLSLAPTWVYCSKDAAWSPRSTLLQELGLRIVSVPDQSGRLDLEAILQDLTQEQVTSLFVEGGAAILTAFLRSDLVDRLLVVTAPLLIGQGLEAVGDLGVERLAQARRPVSSRTWMAGVDTVTELIFRPQVATISG